jgi:YVTN family beta-propeller protein
VTNKIYIANESDNTVTVIDGASNITTTVGVGSSPTSVAVNPVTNKIYVANYFSNNVTVIDGTSNGTSSIVAGSNPYSVAVNPITDKVYIANFHSDKVTVIDVASNSTTTVAADSAPSSVAVNSVTNKIYVPNFGGNAVTVIDGASNSTTTIAAGSNPYWAAVNPVTNKIYVANSGGTTVTVIDEQQVQPIPLTTSITPLASNQTNNPSPSFTFNAQSSTATTPDAVFFQVDTWQNAWTAATGSNPTYAGTVAYLQPGFHILYAYAADGQEATSTQLGSPLTGAIQAYGFLVHGFLIAPPAPTTTTLSANSASSIDGLPVVLTARVKSTVGVPSGTVTFAYGSTVLGTRTLNASGSATFTATTLPVGSDLIMAAYVGNASFAASRGSFTETVLEGAAPVVVSLSPTLGTGRIEAFTAVYSDANGISDLDTVRLLVNASNSTLNGCYVLYSPATNELYMTDNAGNESFAPFAPGQSASAANSQCTLTGKASSVSISGNQIKVTFALTFNSVFSGSMKVYLQAVRENGLSTGAIQEGTWTVPPPAITLSRTTYAFASNPNLPQSGRVYVTNNYSHAISFDPSVVGSGFFTITETCPVIQPNTTCGFQVTYTPMQVGTAMATLYLNPTGGPSGETPSVVMTGLSVSPAILVSRPTLTFLTPVGDSDYERVYITNYLPHTLNLLPVLPSTEFSLANNCSAIAAFETCGINIAFTPTLGEGISENMTLNFANAPASTPSTVRLEADSAILPPVLVSTTNLQLVALMGTIISSVPVSITNYTLQSISLNPALSGSSAFTLSTTCTTLNPQHTCAITVNYSPTAEQIDTALIALNCSNAPAHTPATIELQGFSPSPSRVTVNGLNVNSTTYFTTNPGTFQTSVVTVLNGTSHSLSLAPLLSGSSRYQIRKPCTSIPRDGICQMTVYFAPTIVGSSTASLNVNPTNLRPGDNQNVPKVKFEGAAIPAP